MKCIVLGHKNSGLAAKPLVFLLLLLVVGLLVYAIDVPGFYTRLLNKVTELGAVGQLLFVLAYILSTIAFIPASLLTLGAGAVFGLWNGFALVSLAATLGAIAAFLLGRYVARNLVAEKIAGKDKFLQIDAAVAKQGWKIVLLTRLSPVFPFNLLNYAFGVTKVSLRDYSFMSWLGMLPGTFLYVYLGSLAGGVAEALAGESERGIEQWILLCVGLLATVLVTVVITKIAKQAMQEAVEE